LRRESHEKIRTIGGKNNNHGETHLFSISFKVKTRTNKEIKEKMD